MTRELHAGPTHRAGRAVDQHTGARANVRAPKRAYGAYAFVNDGSRLGKRDVRGGAGNLPARADDHLGAAAVLVVSGGERDPIANADIIHISSESHDLPRSVPAWNLGKADGEVRLQQPGAELAIAGADTRRADPNEHLARSGTRVRDLRYTEYVGSAICRIEQGFHLRVQRLRIQGCSLGSWEPALWRISGVDKRENQFWKSFAAPTLQEWLRARTSSRRRNRLRCFAFVESAYRLKASNAASPIQHWSGQFLAEN